MIYIKLNVKLVKHHRKGDYEIIKVTDINEIIKFGVMMTPGLAVNNEVKSVGKVLSPEEIKKIIS